MKLKNKVIAMALAVCILCVSIFSVASAGAIFDFFASAGKTLAHGFKTVVNAVGDTFEYAFTSKSASECYEDTIESANKVAENAVNVGKNAVKIGEDVADLVVGSGKTAAGLVAAAGTAIYETFDGIVQGEFDYSKSSEFLDMASEGYKQADNGIFMDIASIGAAVTGVPIFAVSAAQAAKAGIEYGVDYKDWDQTKNALINSAVSTVTGSIVYGADIGGYVTTQVATTAINSGTQIALDLTNDNETRSVIDVILEDTAAAASKTLVLNGAKAIASACTSGDAAAQPAAANNDAASESTVEVPDMSNSVDFGHVDLNISVPEVVDLDTTW